MAALTRRNFMKKFLAAIVVFLISACSVQPEQSFKGKQYQLLNAQNDSQVILNFAADEPRYYGKIVNNYFGSYELDGSKIKFGPAGSTMMMGPEPLMEAEQNFLRILPRITAFRFQEKTLILITDNGQELAFEEVGPAAE